MKILIDLNHPAHVHYFRNFIQIMQNKGHKIYVVSRDMEIMKQLLDFYNIKYFLRNKRPSAIIGKFIYVISAVIFIYRISIRLKPDIFLGFASFSTALTSFLMKKISITIDDTDHNAINHLLYKRFTDVLCTPSCFKKKILKNQIFFSGYMELSYLKSKYFKPDPNILNQMGIQSQGKYIILRFISWDASHDRGKVGLNDEFKWILIRELSNHAKVFISSEYELSGEFDIYRLLISAEQMHDALYYSSLVISEGATIASECACLGVPVIYVSSLQVCNCQEQEKDYSLVYNFCNQDGVLEKAKEILLDSEMKSKNIIQRDKMLDDKIDVTDFFVWLIDKYPESLKIMIDNPDYQYHFK